MKCASMVIVLLALAAVPATAAEQVHVRVVEGLMEGDRIDPGLRDVAPFLRETLPFRSFRLIDQGRVRLPSPGDRLVLRPDFVFRAHGPQARFSVTLERGGHPLVTTLLALRDGVPVVVGGFPSQQGRLFLVLVAR